MNPHLRHHINYTNGCPNCGRTEVVSEEVEEQFTYGSGSSEIAVAVVLPVLTCNVCGFSFTDEVAEERRQEAVCLALGVLTPRQIRLGRERLGLSQAELAEISGIGKASISRWERGALVQNEANDNLLRLLSYPENIERLRSRTTLPQEEPSNVVPFRTKFRALPPEEVEKLRDRQSKFRLYS